MDIVPVLITAVATGGLAALLAPWVQVRVATARSAWLRTPVLVALAAAGGAGAAALAPTWPEAVAFAILALAWALLVAVDLAEHRLPDRIVLPAYPALFVALTLAAALSGDWSRLGRSALAAVALCAVYFVLALISPAGLGLGDVKLAGLVGAFLGWLGWQQVYLGTLAAFAVGGFVAAVLVVTRRAKRDSDVAFGPSMMLGALIGAVWTLVLHGAN
ncbi:A24 family peptidase [Antribacter sp. KLBMP9083]|uniref:A24 family peptidase n=1 Tax=Antribacter soli TaxID=2910976 RepID=A0AA41UAL4_9MICO|nr:A24 family peptidase [Antribacter soli]MCF4122807.1 A24 family peptidase [Antribacter soli]